MSLSKFESMLKTNNVYFFDSVEFEEIIQHYIDTGKHSLAKKALQLGLEQHPSSVFLKLLKVEILIFEDELSQAITLLSEVETIDPENEEIFIHKAIIFSKNNKHQEAIEILNKAVKNAGDPEDFWSLIGMEYLYLDDFKNARLQFEKCVEKDLEDYSALYNVIYCFDMVNAHKEAIVYLNTYVDKNPYCEVAWHQLGRQYFTIKMFEKALKAFDYAVLIDDAFIGGYLEKAKTLEELERYQEAIENYLISLELDDPTAYAYIRIGECYAKLSEKTTAISYYKKAIIEDPLLENGWVLLADAYYTKKEYQKALYYIGKAIQIDEKNTHYWRKYANINLKLDYFEEAIIAFNNCISLEDTSLEIYIGLADVLSFLGDYNDALNILITAKKKYLENAEIEYRMAGLFLILKKENYGLIHFKNAIELDFEYHSIVKDLFPTAYNNSKLLTIITDFKQARE